MGASDGQYGSVLTQFAQDLSTFVHCETGLAQSAEQTEFTGNGWCPNDGPSVGSFL